MLKKIDLSQARLQEILTRVKNARICVVGDFCLDMYWHIDMTRSRLSKETPHFSLPVMEEICAPGAGGNVVNNIHALGIARLLPVSVVGKDWRGELLVGWMQQRGISTERIVTIGKAFTPCYCKPMRKGISDVVYEDPRLDFENYENLASAEEAKVLSNLAAAAEEADMIVVSDQYRNGVITPACRTYLQSLAREKPVIVDSRERAALYTGVMLKPNEVEVLAASGQASPPSDIAGYAELGAQLSRKNGQPVIVTLGSQGAIWCEVENQAYAPAAHLSGPLDIVGAGDAFLAAFSCAYAAGIPGSEATAFANLASAVTVQKIGMTGTASSEEIWAQYRKTEASNEETGR